MKAIATCFGGMWAAGENPPDAYLSIGHRKIAVEISILMQHVVDQNGRMVSRLGQDEPVTRMCKSLNQELAASVPADEIVILTLSAPIQKIRKVKVAIKEKLTKLLSEQFCGEIKDSILGNEIEIDIRKTEFQGREKVVGVFGNRASSPDILSNSIYMLDERLNEKIIRSKYLSKDKPGWLALINDYDPLADANTFKQAFESIYLEQNPFEKILLVSANHKVDILYSI